LQALVGCAGAAQSGNCASGALGAASSVVLNNLITALSTPEPRDAAGTLIPRSLADQQTRTALIATLTGAIAGALGANASVASTAGTIETENNALNPGVGGLVLDDRCQTNPGRPNCNHYVAYENFRDARVGTLRADGTAITDPAEANALRAEYRAAEDFLTRLINPGFDFYERSIGIRLVGVEYAPAQTGNLKKPTTEQITFILAAQFNGGVPPGQLGNFVRFSGGVSQIGIPGQSAATSGRAFNETRTLLEGEGSRAYLVTNFAEFSLYSGNPSLIEKLSPADSRRISLALSYVSYRAAITSNLSPSAQALDQRFLDVLTQVSNGNIISRTGSIGVLNGGIDAVNAVTFIPGLLTSHGLAIRAIPNPVSTPAEAAQASGGEAAGAFASIFTPAVASRVFGLGRYGGLSAESTATLETMASPASSAANVARLNAQLAAASVRTDAVALAEVRTTALAAGGRSSSTSAIALVEIDVLPPATVLRANSSVNRATGNLIGIGPQSFRYHTIPNSRGIVIPRSVDAEYKILDDIAARLGGNRSATGSVTIVIDNVRVCGSCQSVISQFQMRYPNVRVDVVRRPR
jgi:hypothetical protein